MFDIIEKENCNDIIVGYNKLDIFSKYLEVNLLLNKGVLLRNLNIKNV